MDSRILFKVSFFEENTVIFLLIQELCGVFSKIQLPGLGKKEGKKDKKKTTNKRVWVSGYQTKLQLKAKSICLDDFSCSLASLQCRLKVFLHKYANL